MDAPKPVYRELYDLVRDKSYFVLTTNVDHCFQKAGFDKKRLFYTQGDYGLFQCSEPCCAEAFENKSLIRNMMKQQKDMRIPTELLPVCPHCGKPFTMNLRADSKFAEDEGWHKTAERYELFLSRHNNMQVLFLEPCVGLSYAGDYQYPFWRMTMQNSRATHACVNFREAICPKEIERQSIRLDGDIGEVLQELGQKEVDTHLADI